MVRTMRGGAGLPDYVGGQTVPRVSCGARATERRNIMKWETPTATDLRFGFEITMYIAAR